MKELKKYDRVLVRNYEDDKWDIDIYFGAGQNINGEEVYETKDFYYRQCIPYKGNEYLLNTQNAPKKCSLDTKWKPKKQEQYWYLSDCLRPYITRNVDYVTGGTDKLHCNVGNCFKTEEEAKEMAEKIKKLLKQG